MQYLNDIQTNEDSRERSNRIEFTDILGKYSCNVAKSILDVINITMKLTKVDINVVYGDYAYLSGYYDQNTSTLTGTWKPSQPIFSPTECACAYGIFKFKFYKRNGEIGFSGTMGNRNSGNGSYDHIEYWVGTKLKDI